MECKQERSWPFLTVPNRSWLFLIVPDRSRPMIDPEDQKRSKKEVPIFRSSSWKMLRVLCDLRNTWSRTQWSGYQLYKQVVESLWELLDVHTLRLSPPSRRHHRMIQPYYQSNAHPVRQTRRTERLGLKLEKLSFAYKTAVHAKTKCSPFELMFGCVPKLRIDLVYDQKDVEDMRVNY